MKITLDSKSLRQIESLILTLALYRAFELEYKNERPVDYETIERVVFARWRTAKNRAEMKVKEWYNKQ